MTEKIRIKGKFVTANIYKKAQALVSDKFNSLEKSKCTLPGRRIVDFAYFGGKFDSGCESCGEIFRFKDFLKETKEGLCSIMYFECKACGNVTGIRTSETYNQSDEGKQKSSSVNVKCALGMIHGGLGPTHINSFLTTMGIPAMCHKTVKKLERIVGPCIEKCAANSCAKASEEEKRLTLQNRIKKDENDENLLELTNFGNSNVLTEKDDEEITLEQALEILEETDSVELQLLELEKMMHNGNTIEESKSDELYPVELDRKMNDTNDGNNCKVSMLDDTMLKTGKGCSFLEPKSIDFRGDRNIDEADIWAEQQSHSQGNIMQTPSGLDEDDCTKDVVDVTVSQDGSWSKRGRGMNSLSGWGHVIGLNTGKCLDYSTRVKTCAKCNRHGPVREHDCRLNWTGSAKAMEADILVQLHKNASANGLHYSAVIGDEDCASIKHIREKVGNVEKYSDFGHLKRTLSNKMEDLHKNKNVKSLSRLVQSDFLHNFTYAFHQNKDKTETDMREAMENIVPHMFGDHSECGNWCQSKKQENYKHSTLPNGKDLTNSVLKDNLLRLLEPFINNPKKLLTSGNSQGNESLNNTAWSKAPKCRNYNKSESFDVRCGAAVCQFNEGRRYVENVCQNAKLTPRKETADYNNSQDRKRLYDNCFKSERKAKRRRVELKKKRCKKEVIFDIKEGTTYSSGCLLEDESQIDTFQIKDAKTYKPVECNLEDLTEIFFDLETTTFGEEAEITEIGACVDSGEKLNTYVMPSGNVTKRASEVTGVVIHYYGGTRQMTKHGKAVNAVGLEESLKQLISWIRNIGDTSKSNVLIAHNGKNFDMQILLRSVRKCGLEDGFFKVVAGFSDSYILLRAEKKEIKTYKLTSLYSDFLQETYCAHSAVEDALALLKVYRAAGIDRNATLKYSIRLEDAINYTNDVAINRRSVKNLQQQMIGNGRNVISNNIAKKICLSGLNYKALEVAFQRNNINGLKVLLTEKVNNRARVTNRKSVIKSIEDFFKQKENV